MSSTYNQFILVYQYSGTPGAIRTYVYNGQFRYEKLQYFL